MEIRLLTVSLPGEEEKMYIVIENGHPRSAATDRTNVLIRGYCLLVFALNERL